MTENTPFFDAYLKSNHPQINDEPSHDLVFEPKDDADFRARAEEFGIDYDQMKRNFLLSHQIISPKPHEEGLQLMDKNAVPLNAVKHYFSGVLEGRILGILERKTPL